MSIELGPYTNFHELNQDWFLNEFNKVLADWVAMNKRFSDLNAAFNDLSNYVHDYFNNLDVQEEIDNKLDSMARDGSLYDIIRKYTDPIVNEQDEKINVLKARMDTFSSLPDGSTAGDAELTDIRVGYNGKVYPSAGDAVREQVSGVNNEIVELGDSFKKEKNLILSVERNTLYSCWGGVGTQPIKETNNNLFTAYGEITGNEGFISSTIEISYPQFSFYTDENNLMIGELNNYRITSYVYSVPKNARHILGCGLLEYLTNDGVVVLPTDKSIIGKYTIVDLPYNKTIYYADNLKFDTVKKNLKNICAPLIPIYVKKDGSGDFTRLIDAIEEAEKTMNRTVYIGEGVWNLVEELGNDYIESVSETKRGVYLKNGIHLIASSRALITCNYEGSNPNTIEWLSAFNSGEYGFTLENCRIESSNCRYTIHDERDSDDDQYKNVYKNCIVKHTKGGGHTACIGGGLGLDGHIIIDGCTFTSDQGTDAEVVSYHNSADGYWEHSPSKGAQSIVEISGSWVSGTIAVLTFGQSSKDTNFLIHGNSLGHEPYYPQEPNPVIKVKSWNNEIRNS